MIQEISTREPTNMHKSSTHALNFAAGNAGTRLRVCQPTMSDK